MAGRMATAALLAATALSGAAAAQTVGVVVDAAAAHHAINPLIYGVAFGSAADLATLRAPVNRWGGNGSSTYSYAANASNLASDWYFESYPDAGAAGASADAFVSDTKTGGASAMLTLPLVGWVARLGPNRSILPSFSVHKYGAQCAADYWDSDAGNGVAPDCATPIVGNDPADAYVLDSPATEAAWVRHLVATWKGAAGGGVRWYAMDNEASLWSSTHRDVHPTSPHVTEFRDKVIAAASMIRSIDRGAKIVGPEEWGWDGYLYSGFDQQYAAAHGWSAFPDRQGVEDGMDYVPWLLTQWKATHAIDVVSVHFYPQGGEFGDDVSTATQLLRNRSTRQLWDPNYVAESWIGQPVYLIPRLKGWVAADYVAGTPVAITEYNWGAEGAINGATAQADVYGIFGAYGLDMATRWTVPGNTTPTFKAMRMYRNYDGAGGAFGDTSVAATVPNPDNLSAFAALRKTDGALTVMVVNKSLTGPTPLALTVGHWPQSGAAHRWQLTAANAITQLPDLAWSHQKVSDTLPAQSVTLYVLPATPNHR